MAAPQTRTEPIGHSVSELTETCIKKFERLLDSGTSPDLLENPLAILRVWADGIDTSAGRWASLGSRPEIQPDGLRLVVNTLRILCEFLDRCSEIHISGYEKDDDGNPALHDVLWGIDISLKSLNLIGAALWQEGKTSRSRLPDKSFNPSDQMDFRRHLECIILMGSDERVGVTDELDSSELDDLQNRLIEANLRRRHSFLAARKHSINLEDSTTKHGKHLQVPGLRTESAAVQDSVILQDHLQQSVSHLPGLVQEKQKFDPKRPTTIALNSTGSNVDQLPLRNNPSRVTPESFQLRIAATASDTKFPVSPDSSSDPQTFECPWCCQSISSTQSWRDHIIQELCPYTCVAANCPTPRALFTTRSEWEDHVRQEHVPDWICPLCDVATKFDSMGHTVDHIQTMHEKEMDEFGISEVLSWYAVRSYGITSCPLCSIKGPKDAPDLVEHVVSHAYDFAFRSLHWSQNDLGDPNKPIDSHGFSQGQHEANILVEQFRESPSINEKAATTKPHTIEQRITQTTDLPSQHGFSELRSMDERSHGKTAQSSGSDRPSKRPERTSNEQQALHYIQRNPRGVQDSDSGSMDSDFSTTGEELVDHLLTRLVKSSFDKGKEFWPHGCIEKIVTREAITKELESSNSLVSQRAGQVNQKTLDALVDFIVSGGRTTFAIALCSSLEGEKLLWAMTHFKALNVDDSSLPIVGDDVKRVFCPTGKGFQYPWSRLSVRIFCSYQWNSLAPVFDTRNRALELHPKAILPFTRTIPYGSSGTFGEVHNITIHPKHKKRGVHANIAIKKLHLTHGGDEDARRKFEGRWDKEIKAHTEITGLENPNIIKFITAVTRDRERLLMFEWADGGNLREFWTKAPRLTRPFVKSVIAQLHGLAHALVQMHSLNYRHGDMKPENILRVKTPAKQGSPTTDIGTLKICDMGLSKQHSTETRLREVGTNTYEPPEAATKDTTWSRRYDTWCFGCIVLEFIVWLVSGVDGLDEFNKKIVNDLHRDSKFFERGRHGEVRVHPQVRATIKTLSEMPQCRSGETALGDLLKLVSTRLLVVDLEDKKVGKGVASDEHADTQGRARADSTEVREALDSIIKRGTKKQAYWLKGESNDDLSSLCAPNSDTSESDAQGSVVVVRQRTSGSVEGLHTTDSSSLFVPILTGSLKIG